MKYLPLAVAAALAALAACNPYLTQQSVAPPGRRARLDEVRNFWGLEHYRLELSEGIAVAMTCNKSGPCDKVRVVSDDPTIAEVRPASLSALEPAGMTMQVPASAFVVVGKSPGTTRVRLRSAQGRRDVYVTVVASPPAPNEQTVAAPAPVR